MNLNDDGVKALKVIKDYLSSKGVDLDGDDAVFYSGDEWTARGEDYGRNAALVVVHESSILRNFMSMDACYGSGLKDPYADYEALQAKLEEEGLFFEECTSWYAAVYKI